MKFVRFVRGKVNCAQTLSIGGNDNKQCKQRFALAKTAYTR